jgi:hypothetical protein
MSFSNKTFRIEDASENDLKLRKTQRMTEKIVPVRGLSDLLEIIILTRELHKNTDKNGWKYLSFHLDHTMQTICLENLVSWLVVQSFFSECC